MTRVETAVIPAAGFGTRFLPATKAVPKEMLPVVDRPMIEYAVAEAVEAGLRRVVIVVSEGKEAIRRHFSPHPQLEAALEGSGKRELLDEVRARSEMAEVEYVVQERQLGLGHAVGVAREAVGGAPFAVLLPDELITSGLLGRLVDVFEERSASAIGLMQVGADEISAYGCPAVEPVADDLVAVASIVEKPAPEDAPSEYATIGRYVFTPELFEHLERIEPGVGGELQLTDAIDLLLEHQGVYGAVLREGRYDVGRKADFLLASIELALARDDLGPELAPRVAALVRDRFPGPG